MTQNQKLSIYTTDMETILATISKIYYQFKKLNKENSAWKQISLKPKKKTELQTYGLIIFIGILAQLKLLFVFFPIQQYPKHIK